MQNAFIRNRTEEFDHDVWGSYVLPIYFPNLGLNDARKSCVLQGGRGCGKTALLRYLSYQSQFSLDRETIPPVALENIGLYLKADAQYFSSFVGDELDERKWTDIFEHALCLALAEQVVGVLTALNCNTFRLQKFGNLDNLNFAIAVEGLVGEPAPSDIRGFEQWLRLQRQMLSRWFKNREEQPRPTMLPMREFVGALIGQIRVALPYMKNSVFAVYIDEYENLLDYQQRFLNSLIKVGEPPLIFHIAMKPNGMRTRRTTGTESIQETADYRLLNLDELLEPEFKQFSAELFFFRLITQAGVPESSTPVSRSQLQSFDFLQHRSSDAAYKKRLLEEIERILPGKKYIEIAQLILVAESTLFKRWEEIVGSALRSEGSTLKVDDFLDRRFPEETLVCAALLNQKTKTSQQVLHELNNLRRGEDSSFREGDWKHKLLVGTILLIYLPLRQMQTCPIYAGFDAFTRLSSTNVRHFLELCHLSIGSFESANGLEKFQVSIGDQTHAAFKASATFRNEVSSCGDYGNRLLSLVNFLGKIFRLSQARNSQSEPEKTHFSIKDEKLSESALKIIGEAIKWSVVFPAPETKVKDIRYESIDYVLNPIYAPFFGLSYNKGRKLELPSTEVEAILTGGVEDMTKLLRQYEKKWQVDGRDQLSFDMES